MWISTFSHKNVSLSNTLILPLVHPLSFSLKLKQTLQIFFFPDTHYSIFKLAVSYIHITPQISHFFTRINRCAYINQKWRKTRLESQQRRRENTGLECVNLGFNEICLSLPNKPPSRYQPCPVLMRALACCHGFAAGDFCAPLWFEWLLV